MTYMMYFFLPVKPSHHRSAIINVKACNKNTTDKIDGKDWAGNVLALGSDVDRTH